uniref:Uncharacterized protein LOC116947558 n=1 Tax=Petromyzon marinus TaxID=7757 RepID=A0AAJ7TJX2_PETMA|nr:uncharacterized protein LOC116947558 [Petromyzon marinus]
MAPPLFLHGLLHLLHLVIIVLVVPAASVATPTLTPSLGVLLSDPRADPTQPPGSPPPLPSGTPTSTKGVPGPDPSEAGGGRFRAPAETSTPPLIPYSLAKLNTVTEQHPTSGVNGPASGAPDPTSGVPGPVSGLPILATGVPDPVSVIPFPVSGVPDRTSGIPFPVSGVPDLASGIPFLVSGVPHRTPGVPGPTPSVPDSTSGVPHSVSGIPHSMSGVPGDASNEPRWTPMLMPSPWTPHPREGPLSRSPGTPTARAQGDGGRGGDGGGGAADDGGDGYDGGGAAGGGDDGGDVQTARGVADVGPGGVNSTRSPPPPPTSPLVAMTSEDVNRAAGTRREPPSTQGMETPDRSPVLTPSLPPPAPPNPSPTSHPDPGVNPNGAHSPATLPSVTLELHPTPSLTPDRGADPQPARSTSPNLDLKPNLDVARGAATATPAGGAEPGVVTDEAARRFVPVPGPGPDPPLPPRRPGTDRELFSSAMPPSRAPGWARELAPVPLSLVPGTGPWRELRGTLGPTWDAGSLVLACAFALLSILALFTLARLLLMMLIKTKPPSPPPPPPSPSPSPPLQPPSGSDPLKNPPRDPQRDPQSPLPPLGAALVLTLCALRSVSLSCDLLTPERAPAPLTSLLVFDSGFPLLTTAFCIAALLPLLLLRRRRRGRKLHATGPGPYLLAICCAHLFVSVACDVAFVLMTRDLLDGHDVDDNVADGGGDDDVAHVELRRFAAAVLLLSRGVFVSSAIALPAAVALLSRRPSGEPDGSARPAPPTRALPRRPQCSTEEPDEQEVGGPPRELGTGGAPGSSILLCTSACSLLACAALQAWLLVDTGVLLSHGGGSATTAALTRGWGLHVATRVCELLSAACALGLCATAPGGAVALCDHRRRRPCSASWPERALLARVRQVVAVSSGVKARNGATGERGTATSSSSSTFPWGPNSLALKPVRNGFTKKGAAPGGAAQPPPSRGDWDCSGSRKGSAVAGEKGPVAAPVSVHEEGLEEGLESLSLSDIELRPPSPIDLRRSIHEALGSRGDALCWERAADEPGRGGRGNSGPGDSGPGGGSRVGGGGGEGHVGGSVVVEKGNEEDDGDDDDGGGAGDGAGGRGGGERGGPRVGGEGGERGGNEDGDAEDPGSNPAAHSGPSTTFASSDERLLQTTSSSLSSSSSSSSSPSSSLSSLPAPSSSSFSLSSSRDPGWGDGGLSPRPRGPGSPPPGFERVGEDPGTPCGEGSRGGPGDRGAPRRDGSQGSEELRAEFVQICRQIEQLSDGSDVIQL